MIRPLNRNVLVTRVAAVKETASGIILKRSDEPDLAIVEAVADDVTEVVVGEKTLVNWNKATKYSDEQYVISVDEIILVLEDD
mgnify:FL=1